MLYSTCMYMLYMYMMYMYTNCVRSHSVSLDCRSFLRLGNPLCCTINDITIDQLEREGKLASPVTKPDNPSPDAYAKTESGLVAKQESNSQNSLDASNSKTPPTVDKEAVIMNGVGESEKFGKESSETEKPVCSEKNDVTNQKAKYGGSLSLARIQSLVSMTTPRSSNLSTILGSPSFIEIDHSIDGFGCLFLPSVFPQTITAPQQPQGGPTY